MTDNTVIKLSEIRFLWERVGLKDCQVTRVDMTPDRVSITHGLLREDGTLMGDQDGLIECVVDIPIDSYDAG